LDDGGLRVRQIDDPASDPACDASWVFKTARLGDGMVLVVCTSMSLPHGPPGQRAAKAQPSRYLEAPRKTAGDFLVSGHAWANPARPGIRVVIELDGYRKELAVFGDRFWQRGPTGLAASAPQTFTKIPITYEHAFGGEGYMRNPRGIGCGSGERGRRIPNVVRLSQPTPRPDEQAEAAGFGPIDPSWQPRVRMLGTYDDAWVADRWPGPPADFDPRYWNEAPADQQFPGYFRGDEQLAFENMHPEHARLLMRLPGRRPRAFAAMSDGKFREVHLVLDTIAVDLDAELTELVWRGDISVRSPRLREIDFLFTSVENLATATDLAAWRHRFESARQARYPTLAEQEAELSKRPAAREAARAEQLADTHRQVDAALMLLGAVRPLRRASPAQGAPAESDIEADLRSAIERMRIQDPKRADELETRLWRVDAQLGTLMTQQAAKKWTRERVIAAHRTGNDMAEADLSGVDLAGLDLIGAKLARAKLTGARLAGAKLRGADLSGADLRNADAHATDFTASRLVGTRFVGAQLRGARFDEASIERAEFIGVDGSSLSFARTHGDSPNFSGAGLAGAVFAGAQLPRAIFSSADIAGAVFDNAALGAADFRNATGEAPSYREADLTNLRATAAALPHAKLAGVVAPRSVWEQAKLDGADFSRAVLTKANLSEASLVGAVFDRAQLDDATMDDAVLQDAVLTNANLLRASFERADLSGADLRRSNLYRAGLFEAVAPGTRFDGAFLVGARLPRWPKA
jgi:uncharacterized protein YjbI with pentapeptide repeats